MMDFDLQLSCFMDENYALNYESITEVRYACNRFFWKKMINIVRPFSSNRADDISQYIQDGFRKDYAAGYMFLGPLGYKGAVY